MAKYIEFIGVPGVGKTTTYLALRSGKKKDNWILYEELFGNSKRRKIGIRERLEILLHYVLNPNSLPRVQRDSALLHRFVQQNPDLVDIFWNNLTKRDHAYKNDLRFYTANYISGIFEKIQSITESTCTRFCLVDEGLIHNLNCFMVGAPDKNNQEEMKKILQLVQLPAAVVYFDGEIETIVERTISRGHFRPKDAELSREQITESRKDLSKEKNFSVQVLRTLEIPVLVVRAQDSLEKKSAEINSFISSLHHQMLMAVNRED